MIEKLKKRLEVFQKTLENLKTGIETSTTNLQIDGTLKRFELCCEQASQLIETYLEYLGLWSQDPKERLKQAFQNGLIENIEKWCQLLEDRERLICARFFEESGKIFEKVKLEYFALLEDLLYKVKKQLEE